MNFSLKHIALFILFFAGFGRVYAQEEQTDGIPLKDTEIVNIASGTYERGDGIKAVNSNSVLVKIIESSIVHLYPSQAIKEFRGHTVELTHYLTNQGNASGTYSININNLEGDDYDLEDLLITSEGKLKSKASNEASTTVDLGPGETFEFKYQGYISTRENKETAALVSIVAKNVANGSFVENVDTISVLASTKMSLEKLVVGEAGKDKIASFVKGDLVTYALKGANTGDITAYGREISIDGNIVSKVILKDKIPLNVTFEKFIETSNNGQELYHIFGSDEYEFTSKIPAALDDIDIIGVAFDSVKVDETYSTEFSVRINEGASDSIYNAADITYIEPEGGIITATTSNEVIVTVSGASATLDYFTNGSYTQITGTSTIGKSLFLQANAGACNEDASIAETAMITIQSTLTADKESFETTETGRNTGIFRVDEEVPTRNALLFSPVTGNKIMEVLEDDQLIAVLDCQKIHSDSVKVISTIYMDPYGVVFDVETNSPVAGAEVRLIDVTGKTNGGQAGGLAHVYDMDGTTEIENIQITDESGIYRYPFLKAGTYRIEVNTPKGYEFPSKVSQAYIDSARSINDFISYGKEFVITKDAPIDTDIPLDPLGSNVLFTQKKADKATAEIGDYLNYTVTIKSDAVNSIDSVKVEDTLPFGFEYQSGSSKIDGEVIPDPEGGAGPTLLYNIGSLKPKESVDLTYKVYVGPGADRGDGINTAIASSKGLISRVSLPSKVKIEVQGGVFSNDAFIVGKVFSDCNENKVQDAGEPGIPGVRLYLETGSYVITDPKGKYTFYGIKPNKHTLKVDNTTLPAGSRLSVLDNRHANDPSSRFVDLKNGELHRADFAICNCNDEGVQFQIEQRIMAYSKSDNELESSVKKGFSMTEQKATKQTGHGQVSGVVGGGNAIDLKNTAPNKSKKAKEEVVDTLREVPPRDLLLEAVNAGNADLEFINIADGDTVKSTHLQLQVKSNSTATLFLYVNEKLIGVESVGRTEVNQSAGVQGIEFFGLQLKVGQNELRLQEKDPFGNVRAEQTVNIVASGNPSQLIISVPENDIDADGESIAAVVVEIVDENGVHVGSEFQVSLDISEENWIESDENPRENGTQVSIINGKGVLHVKAPKDPKTVRINAKLGTLEDDAKINFVPDLRPLIAAGIIEGSLRLNESLNISSTTGADGFERELKALSYGYDTFTADGRIAFFLKGKVAGSTLLTAGYDSEKDVEERLFRDIRPDEFYPVYGETSVKGYEAQSSGRLYVRVDRNKTYAIYGDFITQERDQDRQLGDYSRAQTGLKTHLEQGAIKADLFGSEAFSKRIVREFQGQGISRYELPDEDIVSNSEIIELLVYDRDQPDVLLSSNRLTRFVDYSIESFSGTLVFTQPISSVDENFNTVIIRATYEVENGGNKYLIGGASVEANITEELKVGAGVVQDQNPENNFNLTTLNASYELNKKTKVVIEGAQTNTDDDGVGKAGRVEIQHKGKNSNVQLQVGRSNKDFANHSTTLGKGKTEAKVKGRLGLGGKTNMNAEALYSRNDTTGNKTVGGLMSVQKSFSGNINAEVGLRYSRQENGTASSATEVVENTNLRSKLTADVPHIEGASTFVEYEQDLKEVDNKLIAVGGDYKVGNYAKIYARHEFASTAQGRYTLNDNVKKQNTVFGIKSSYMKNGEVYSEYRVKDAVDGASGQASIGMRNNFKIKDGFNANAGFERIFTVKGDGNGDGTAISTSLDYTANPNWKATAKAEARFAPSTDTYVNSVGYGQRINSNWTFLGKNILALTTKKGESGFNKVQERVRLGGAYRDAQTNMWDALFRYEFKYETDNNISTDFNRAAHIYSSHANYHPAYNWTFSGKAAAKYAIENDTQFRETSFLELFSTRALYDINEKWDAGVNASILANKDFSAKDYGVGVEAGFLAATNLRIATGFNFTGYEDEDLTDNSYTRKGVYLGFSYKFDEQLFDRMLPASVKGGKALINPDLYLTCDEMQPCIGVTSVELLPFTFQKVEVSLEPVALESRFGNYEPLIKLPRQIHFDNDKSYINRPAALMLDKLAKFLIRRDDYHINVTGHTDSKSSYSYNLGLSKRRAIAVRAYLISAGVDPEKVSFEGMSYSENARPERNRVDMAYNRRVELDLSDINTNVRFIDQVEDMQVFHKVPGVGDWDYVYNAEHNSVPSAMHIPKDGIYLSYVNDYLLERIAIALAEYREVDIEIVIPDDANLNVLAQNIPDVLNLKGLEYSRVSVKRGNTGSANLIKFNYSKPQLLNIVDQNDDVKFNNNENAQNMMESILNIIKSREDYSLLRDRSQTYVVPDRVNFKEGSSVLSNETQAVLSRIGSYLLDDRAVYIEMKSSGTPIDKARMMQMKKYLIEWGIPESRITISEVNVPTGGYSIMLNYMNADAINLLESDVDNPNTR